jgi:hypothetical protein
MNPQILVRFLNSPREIQIVKKSKIFPFKSRTPFYDSLINLKVGDRVDACDTKNVWIESTVFDRYEEEDEENGLIVSYEIGYRADENGWGPNYDEKILSTSSRLALPSGFRARKFWKPAST